MNDILDTLTCPITLELIEDPVQLPCCGKSVSRAALIQALEFRDVCPLCRSNLSDFDASQAPPNRDLISIIESIQKKNEETEKKKNIMPIKEHQWGGNVEWINNENPSVGRLNLEIKRSHFKTNKVLFVAIVDNSGSMSGSPWRQVQTALTHILSLTATKIQSVETRIITYNSTATLLPMMNDPSELNNSIQSIQMISACGGTQFLAAYQKLYDLLDDIKNNRRDEFSSVSIAFLTDGQDNGDKSTLTNALKHIFEPFNDVFRIIVHAIGFSSDCDKNLLEQMRTAGTAEGTFRYAEPGDDADTLCGKLTDLFNLSEKAATAKVEIELPEGFEFITDLYSIKNTENNNNSNDDNIGVTSLRKKDCYIHVEPFTRRGEMVEWIVTKMKDPPAIFSLKVNSSEDKDVDVNVLVSMEKSKDNPILQAWLRKVLDWMARELLDINKNRNKIAPQLLRLQVALFLSRLKAIAVHINDTRIEALRAQIEIIQKGGAVNEGKLQDMRFSSMFTPEKAKAKSSSNYSQTTTFETTMVNDEEPKKIVYQESPVKYGFNNNGKERNALQEAIMNAFPHRRNENVIQLIQKATDEEIRHTDIDGNNALHLAAYCGSPDSIESIVNRYPKDSPILPSLLKSTNKYNETAVTLAIKRKGYHHSLAVLTGAGGFISEHRVESLKRFCIQQGFTRTAEIISNMNTSENGPNLDLSMSAEYIKFQWESTKKRGNSILASDWLQPAMAKCLIDIVKELVSNKDYMKDFKIPYKWFIDYCLPPKPDHPEVEKYIELTKAILDVQPELLNGKDEDTGDTTLIHAVDCGNLPFVQLFLDLGVEIDEENELGNTPLWLACAKRYPCIVTELVSRGSDVNHPNKKGNRPLNAVCQMGPLKVAEFLIGAGAEVEFYNSNGDTPLLIACRNGQAEVVKLLLGYLDDNFVKFRAKIDGFDALFASVEADRPDCVRLVAEYGISLEERTDEDNEILQKATPLHLAAYYGRTESASVLLELGANPNSKDISGRTPLHIAVLRKNTPIIELLISSNADPFAVDDTGNIPSAFTRDPDVLKLLVNPISEPLHTICATKITSSTGYTIEDVKDILENKSSIPGLNEPRDVIESALNEKRMTPLMTSVIYSNLNLVEILMNLGFDADSMDGHGITPKIMAQWIRNPRILKLLNTKVQDCPEIQRLRKATQGSPDSLMMLFLNDPQNYIQMKSSLSYRLDMISLMTPDLDKENQVNSIKQLAYEEKSQNLTVLFENKPPKNKSKSEKASQFQEKLMNMSKSSLWQAKIQAVEEIASGCNEELTPSQLISLFLYTCDRNIFEVFTYFICGRCNEYETQLQSIIYPFTKALWTAVEQLPPFKAEVYCCSNSIDRNLFRVGNVVSSPTFVSASSLWPIALESINFQKSGTVFIIKSENKGKLISSHSSFSFESEVLFLPTTKFVVAKWYRGDVIALGQPNIRDHTFGLTEEQMNTLCTNTKPLIIELHEV